MEVTLVKTVATLVLPPGANLLCILAGVLVGFRFRAIGRAMVAVGIVSLYLLSTSLGADWLSRGVQAHPALTPATVAASGAQAIVILGGGRYPEGPEFGRETVSEPTLVRLRYGAFLARHAGLPVLVTGGRVHGESTAEAELMRDAASDAFGLEVKWVEDQSFNTAENGLFSARILKAEGIAHVALVTHSVHMRRAVTVFERTGLRVTPAPTQVDTRGDGDYPFFDLLLPTANNLHQSASVLHEWVGLLWYALRYRTAD